MAEESTGKIKVSPRRQSKLKGVLSKKLLAHHCDDSFDGLGRGTLAIGGLDQGAAQILDIERYTFQV
jgi:hypothetical protein